MSARAPDPGRRPDPDRRPDPARPRPGQPPGRPQNGPFVVRCPPGRYAHCQCRQSSSYPYCDGSHRHTTPPPDCDHAWQPVKVQIDEPRLVAWCACGRSGTMPFCDGSHARGG